jgi:hypothetical protein
MLHRAKKKNLRDMSTGDGVGDGDATDREGKLQARRRPSLSSI